MTTTSDSITFPEGSVGYEICVRWQADVERLTAERDEARNHLQAVREFAHGLGASTASRGQILDACTRMPFAPEHGTLGTPPC